jgi:hypothetical protein
LNKRGITLLFPTQYLYTLFVRKPANVAIIVHLKHIIHIGGDVNNISLVLGEGKKARHTIPICKLILPLVVSTIAWFMHMK